MGLHRAQFNVSCAFVEKESVMKYIQYSSYNFTVISLDFNIINLSQNGTEMVPESNYR